MNEYGGGNMSNNYIAGSEWRKWDLHLHTPSSYDYENKSVTNQEIIDKLVENDISVVAITDHHTIDIERIKELQKLGVSKVTVLPGIEFLSDARGKEPIHFIAIFSEDSNIEYIWGQLKNKTNIEQIEGKGTAINAVYCHLLDTINLVKELGGIVTIHAGDKSNGIKNITNSLPHAVAQKTDITMNIDIFEMGKETDQEGYKKHVFPSIGKIVPMVICSDNHKLSEYKLKAYCWIKADPNFNGLKQAIYEPETRFYIGTTPPKMNEVKQNQSKYLSHIKVCRSNEKCSAEWFSAELPLNPGLIAIIGNKGSGKSALGDIIGLAGNSKQEDNFSFLHKDRFRKAPQKIAQNFSTTLTWRDGRTVTKNLNEKVVQTDIEELQYLPQKFIEIVCNGLEDEFETEINRIVFSYLPEENRLQKESFKELMKQRCNGINSSMQNESLRLKEFNAEIIELEKKAVPEYKESLESKMKLTQDTQEALRKNKPQEVAKPLESTSNRDNVKIFTEQIDETQKQIDIKQGLLNNIVLQISTIDTVVGKIDSFKENIRDEQTKIQGELAQVDIQIPLNMELICNIAPLNEHKEELCKQRDALNILLNKEGDDNKSLFFKKKELENQKNEITKKMGLDEKTYHKYTEDLVNWEKQCADSKIEEQKLKEDINYLTSTLARDLKIARDKRLEIVKKIYQLKQQEAQIYQEIYAPVLKYIKEESALQETPDEALNFSVTKKLEKNFIKDFLEYINQAVLSDFKGVQEGQQKLKEIIEKYNFDEENDTILFIDEIYQILTNDLTRTDSIVKKRPELYNFLFGLEYLDVSYELKLGKFKLEQLSPGEKGSLLLIFYLFLDKNKSPLVIDQPEDNLDNYSVFNRLVPYIRKAKERRQVIIVTHNPNLAIACDAEQIIYAKMDKQNLCISYESGSIENPNINKHIVDVLEGTMPAFTLRRIKYFT